jgi:hypothetical protein
VRSASWNVSTANVRRSVGHLVDLRGDQLDLLVFEAAGGRHAMELMDVER